MINNKSIRDIEELMGEKILKKELLSNSFNINCIKFSTNDTDRPIIIFPQGTRVDEKNRDPFKKGIIRIYENLNIKCQPVAINSGSVWPKSGNLNPNRRIIISIIEPIESNINGNEFLNLVEKKIYSELDNISNLS